MMKGVALTYSDNIKYLGLLINNRLSWSGHIKTKTKKATRILHHAKALVGKKWGLSPERVFWIYQALVRPTISYGSLVWAHTLTQSQAQMLERVQRKALLAMSHAMRSTPTKGMEVVMGLPPLDLYIQEQATRAMFRLKDTLRMRWEGISGLKRQPLGHRKTHNKILNRLNLNDETDMITPKRNWDPLEEPLLSADYVIFTDGSKFSNAAGAGWLLTKGDNMLMNEHVPLEGHATVFQAEIKAITSAVTAIANGNKYSGHFVLYSDSQAAIQALRQTLSKSKLVIECIEAIKTFKRKGNTLELKWIKGHADHTGNEVADYLAKQACLIRGDAKTPKSLAYGKDCIKNYYIKQWQSRWNETPDCRQTRLLFPIVEPNIKRNLRLLSKNEITRLIQMGTGHCLLAYHVAKWRNTTPTCKLCLEDDESPIHLLQDCPALWWERLEYQAVVESKDPARALLDFFDNENIYALEQLNLS